MNGQPNIVFIILDSLRWDHCSCLGDTKTETPVLDDLADDGILYTNVRSTASWTVPAMASIFTGKLPSEVGTHTKSRYLKSGPEQTLAGRLKAAGYSTYGVSANPWLSKEFGFDSGFNEFSRLRYELPHSDAGDPRDVAWPESSIRRVKTATSWTLNGHWLQRARNLLKYSSANTSYADAETVNKELQTFISKDSKGPKFLFANYMDAHEPYHTRTPLDVRPSTLNMNWNLESLTSPPKTDPADIHAAYRDATEYLDTYIGELLSSLNEADCLDNSFIVICSDHGQALGEYGYWGHGNFLYDSLLRVPVIVRPPEPWTQSDTPEKINTPLSIRWIFDLLLECANCNSPDMFEFGVTAAPKPVIAESHGQVQDLEVSLPEDQSTMSRRFYSEDGKVSQLCYPDGATSWRVETEGYSGTAQVAEEAHATMSELPKLQDTDRANNDFEDGTKQQLKSLGYL